MLIKVVLFARGVCSNWNYAAYPSCIEELKLAYCVGCKELQQFLFVISQLSLEVKFCREVPAIKSLTV